MSQAEIQYVYLHGFASGVRSQKARFFQTKFAEKGLELHLPDLNLGNFAEVTLTKQLDYLQTQYGNAPLVLIGSSLGGFLAVQMAVRNPLVKKLILLAPAFQFGPRIAERMGQAEIAKWQSEGKYDFYHYSENCYLPLRYEFFTDAQTYSETSLKRDVSILIIHGTNDDVVPAFLSEDFAKSHANVNLELVDSDHSLGNVLDLIWNKTQAFLKI